MNLQQILVGLGSDDGVRMWLNGKEVHNNYIDRGLVVDDDIFEISLNKGSNQLLIKVLNGMYDYGFSIRPVSGSAVSDLLLRSASTGNFDNVKTLVKYSPDYSKKDETGLDAWQLATIKGRADIAKFLEEQGANKSTEFPSWKNTWMACSLRWQKRKKHPGW